MGKYLAIAGLLIGLIGGDYYLGGTLWYNSPRWEDLRFPATTLRPQTGASYGAPDWVQFPIGGSIETYVPCMDAAQDEGLSFIGQTRHSRKDATDLHPHVHWAPSDGGAGDVTWIVVCTTLTDIGDVFGESAPIVLTDTAAGVVNTHQVIENGALSGAGTTISAMTVCSVYRDVDNADDYGADACLLEVDFHEQTDTPGGSFTEGAK